MPRNTSDFLKIQYELTTTKFEDNDECCNNDLEYARRRKEPGLVLIFNQVKFDNSDLSERAGSNRDVNNLVSTLHGLRYNISKKENIFNDFDRKEVLCKINEIVEDKESLSIINSLILIFLTHGDRNNVLYTKQGQLHVDEIVKPFQLEELKGIPKLFVFQACKGTESEITDENHLTCSPFDLPSDIVIYFSTVEGDVAVRHRIKGTWLIGDLCNNLQKYGKKEDVISLLQRTSKCVAINDYYEKKHEKKSKCKKQMPVLVSTLSKQFFLTNSKDRRELRRHISEIQELKDRLTNVEKQVEKLIHSNE